MFSPIIAALRFIGFVLWTLVAMGPYLVLLASGWKNYSAYARRYFKLVARILGFRVMARGVPAETGRPVLYVCNHASYLDIIVLGSLMRACFVAKSEVAGWPGFGFLARIAQTVFVDRNRRGTGKERDSLRKRLEAGDSLILFPEGTSNDGNRVLPFKSSLFAVAEPPLGGEPLLVQPVSIAYTRLDGMAMGRAFRPFYAWYGDMTLAGHLFQALGLGRPTVEVVFHPPVTIAHFPDRKALSNHCHDVVQRGVVLAIAGRAEQTPHSHHAMPEPLPMPAEA